MQQTPMPVWSVVAVRLSLLASLLLGALSSTALAQAADADARQYVFSWMFRPGDAMAPRGGTTRGLPVTLAQEPSSAWLALQEDGIAPMERDRRAILAMVGEFRSSFEFIETVGFVENYQPARPYQSWATEFVALVEDRGDFISLQHILVMTLQGDDGEVMGPFVTKHWRQDWQYEAREMHTHRGNDRWQRTLLSAEARVGSWVQSVYQVDDSPRYASWGRWHHDGGQSVWEGAATLRPLPRREFEVRSDYHVLDAINRHIITPTGWAHEEQNLKRVTGENPAILARELGFNRYERIASGHDFHPGYAYWERTGAFWQLVREQWQATFAAHDAFTLKTRVDGALLFVRLFDYAERLTGSEALDAAAARQFVQGTLAEHVRSAE
jgi:hypothetical protein